MTRFKDFWPLYLQAHRHRGTRIGHYAATTIALTTIAASIALQEIWLTALGIVLGYAIALAAHRLVDGSKSLVTVNPVWGAVADFKMCWLALDRRPLRRNSRSMSGRQRACDRSDGRKPA